MRRITSIIAATVLVLTAHAALAASAGDPKDTPKGLDVSRSSIRTIEIADGVFRTRIAVSTYHAFDLSTGKASFYWQIDSYGDRAVDYIVYMFGDPDANPPRPLLCLVKSKNPDHPYRAYVHVAATDTRVVCGLPERDLRTTKAIRWRLAGRKGDVIDRAPDTGWYG